MMEKQHIAIRDLDLPPFTAFDPNGLLLVSGQNEEHANVMTIGWGMFGIMWSRPVVMVMVRPTRYTWDFITQAADFTVNWMGQQWTKAVQMCGTTSGREVGNKFTVAGLHAEPGQQTESPIIKESILALECRIIYRDVVRPESFIEPGLKNALRSGRYHGLFYGEVVAATGTDYFRHA